MKADTTLMRPAGLMYLTIIVAGVWSEGFVRGSLVVPEDAAATAANILANQPLFRASFAADTIMALSDAGLAVALFLIFRAAAPGLALAAMVFRLIQTAVLTANLIFHHAALLALTTPEPDAPLALLLLNMQSHGYDLGLIFFAVNSVLTGALLIAAGAPRALGAGLAAAGLVYLTGSALRFLAPNMAEFFMPAYVVPLLAESAFAVWLLVARRPAATPA